MQKKVYIRNKPINVKIKELILALEIAMEEKSTKLGLRDMESKKSLLESIVIPTASIIVNTNSIVNQKSIFKKIFPTIFQIDENLVNDILSKSKAEVFSLFFNFIKQAKKPNNKVTIIVNDSKVAII